MDVSGRTTQEIKSSSYLSMAPCGIPSIHGHKKATYIWRFFIGLFGDLFVALSKAVFSKRAHQSQFFFEYIGQGIHRVFFLCRFQNQ